MEYGIIFFVGLLLVGVCIALDGEDWRTRAQVGIGVFGIGTTLFGLAMSVSSLFS